MGVFAKPLGSLLLIALTMALLAGGLRFFRLGAWPFAGDELATFSETESLFGKDPSPPESQNYRLARLVPLSYAVHYAGYQLFGRDEWGSRVVVALFGTLQIVLVFVSLAGPLGRPAALATALLLLALPEHLVQSQQNRFYMMAAFFATVCMAGGAVALQRRSIGLMMLACLGALAAILCHTVQGLLVEGLFIALMASAIGGQQRPSRAFLGLIAATGLIGASLHLLYLRPLLRGWNSQSNWGYTSQHALVSAVNQLGWPVALLVALGVLLAIRRPSEQNCYWLTWAGLWAGAAVVLPFAVAYHPAYVFPFILGPVALAGIDAAEVYVALCARKHNLPAGAFLVGVVFLNLPGLVSHYQDGSRFDFRTAAQYIAAHRLPGDQLASTAPGLLAFYSEACRDGVAISATDPIAAIERLGMAGRRIWVVFPSNRGGKPEDLRRWFGTHCSQELEIRQQRFDYSEFTLDVYLYPSSACSLASQERR
jgi:hypothetical protein